MKKIARKIAMILVLVMLANSFSGCTFMLPYLSGKDMSDVEWWKSLGLGILIDLLILGIFALTGGFAEAPNETESGIYLVKAEDNSLTVYYSLMEKLNSLPEKERASLMEKLNSLPENKRVSLVSTIKSIPETESVSSIKRLNALPKTKFASLVRTFNALSETELDSLIETLKFRIENKDVALIDKSLPETEYTDTVDYYEEKTYMELCFQY